MGGRSKVVALRLPVSQEDYVIVVVGQKARGERYSFTGCIVVHLFSYTIFTLPSQSPTGKFVIGVTCCILIVIWLLNIFGGRQCYSDWVLPHALIAHYLIFSASRNILPIQAGIKGDSLTIPTRRQSPPRNCVVCPA